jgi:4-hydroxyacetophenone monooxygenase
VGALNQPKLPEIPGMDDFAGPWFHSARWDPEVEWRGTRFGLVGAGASGFQIAPTIADEVEHLTVFQRTAQWMFPNPNYHAPVPSGDTWAMRHLPFYGRWFRFLTFYPAAGLSMDRNRIDPEWDDGGRSISAANAQTRELFSGWITSQLQDRPDLVEACIPHYPPSAKRMLQDNGSWLGCLKKPNVELVRTGIEKSCPRASSPSTAPSTSSTSSATPPASGTTTSSGRCTSSGATVACCATSGGSSPPRTSGSP